MNIHINICRVCMKSDTGKSMCDLHLNSNKLKFEFVTHLRVQSDDNLPALICEKCQLLLNLSHKFIQSAHDTEKNLKAFLTKISNDFQLVTKSTSENTATTKEEDVDEMLNLLEISKSSFEEKCLSEPEKSPAESGIEKALEKAEKYEISDKNEETVLSHSDIGTDILQPNEANSLADQSNENSLISCILEPNSDTVHLTETSIDEEHIKNVTLIEEYEALLEEESTSIDILYENDESLLQNATNDVDCNADSSKVDDTFVLEPNNTETEDMSSLIVETMLSSNDFVESESSKELETMIEITAEDDNNKFAIEDTDSKFESASKTPLKKQHKKKKVLKKTLTESKRYYCNECKRDFSTKTNLTRHLALHEGKKRFQCHICLKGFSQNGSLKQHMYTHTGEKPYVCEICQRGFTQSKSLVFHMRRHTGAKPHPCDYCNALFRQKDALKAHILKYHVNSKGKEFSCKICTKEMSAQLLRSHMKSHLNNHKSDGHIQPVNNLNFLKESISTDNETNSNSIASSTHVIDVMATSTIEPSRAKKLQCRKCFKCFAIKENLIRHLKFHEVLTVEMQHCKNCDLTFGTPQDLEEHFLNNHKESEADSNESNEFHFNFQNITDFAFSIK